MEANMSGELPLLAAATPRTPLRTVHGPSETDTSRFSSPLSTSSAAAQTRESAKRPSQPLRRQHASLGGHEQPHGPSRGEAKRKDSSRQPQYTCEEWDSVKEAIRELYIVQSRPLDFVVQHMTQTRGFSASRQMYKKKFREWGMYKNQSSRQAESRVGAPPEQLAKRHRSIMAHPVIPEACNAGPAFQWRERELSGWIDPEMEALGCLITNATSYLDALFDQGRRADPVSGWKGDSFGLIAPRGRKDYSLEWKMVADQCHGASSLARQGKETRSKCHQTLLNVFRDIDRLAQHDDPWMLVYLWRIILYMRGISYRVEHDKTRVPSVLLAPRNDHLVGHTVSRIARRIHPGCYMVDCLNSLRAFSLDKMKLALERVFKACMDTFGRYLGHCHPVVLLMAARFLRYWPAGLADHVVPNYESLVARSEAELEPSDERRISFLTEYMYIAHYHVHDAPLTRRLARKICERVPEVEPVPRWGRATYGLVLASKLLSKIEKESGGLNSWQARLDRLASRLRNGDRECQTRALQIRRMMATWYREAGDEPKSLEETARADGIFKSMKEAVVQQGGWDGS